MATTINYSDFKSTSYERGRKDANVKFLEKAMQSTTKVRCQISKELRATSAFGKDKDHCLCKVLRPVIFMLQIVGVMPVTYDKEACKMKHKWLSLSVLYSFLCIISNCIGAARYGPVVKKMFDSELGGGIDSFAFRTVLGVQFLSTFLIFIAGNFNAPKFVKAWDELHSTTEEVAMPNFRRIKLLTYLLPLYLAQEVILNGAIQAYLYFVDKGALDTMPPESQWGMITSNLVPNLVTGVYAVCISIVAQNFRTINKGLRKALNMENPVAQTHGVMVVNSKEWNPKLPFQIARFRILHERLCQTVRLLEKAFGVQIMLIFAGTCVSVVSGIYGLIIGTQGLASAKMNGLIIGFGLSTLISSWRVVLAVWFCQNLMNEANGTAHILNRFNPEMCSDEEVNVQVTRFLDKLGDFPLCTTCCNMFELGNRFLASASSTIATYVLILIQFRADEK